MYIYIYICVCVYVCVCVCVCVCSIIVSGLLVIHIQHIYIHIHIHIPVFRPAQDSPVWLGLTSREQLMSPKCSLNHEIYTKCKKKPANWIKGISTHNIFSGIKSQQINKIFVNQLKKLLSFLRIPLFHFIESLLTIQFHVCFNR